jgi:hypothetical protein
MLEEVRYRAFESHLDGSGACFVSHQESEFEKRGAKILASKGLPALPHPKHFGTTPKILAEELIPMKSLGLRGIEVYHRDHTVSDAGELLGTRRQAWLSSKGRLGFPWRRETGSLAWLRHRRKRERPRADSRSTVAILNEYASNGSVRLAGTQQRAL